ncbi:MAG: TIGR02117 family protein [Cytophagales bacterium]|nr:TIGR02117 family protein [Cytophagales bacterium]
MKTIITYFFKSLKVLSLSFLSGISVYVFCAWAMPIVQINTENYPTSSPSHTIYLMTNGVHTDVVLPVRSNIIHWDSLVPFENVLSNDTNFRWLAFGWGDKGFYLNTPTWDDLTFGTAFKAATGLSSTAMHCTYYRRVKEDAECVKILIKDAQLAALSQYVRQSFRRDSTGKFEWIHTNAVYGKTDAFYEAIGNYSLLTTCNTWTNNGLKAADLPACWWTPLDKGLMQVYFNLNDKK